jgi:hypothetical protein
MSWFGHVAPTVKNNKNHSVKSPGVWKMPKQPLLLSPDGLVVTNCGSPKTEYIVQSKYPLVRNSADALPYFEILIQELEPEGYLIKKTVDIFICFGYY